MSPSEHDEIIALVTRLQVQNAELMAANEELRMQLAESHRSGRRQAAPFSKGKRSSKPKRLGRKPGMDLFSYRKPPLDEEITGPVVEVPVSEDTCPRCGRCGREHSLRNRHTTCSASAGESTPSAGMPVPVVRQGCARPASRHSAGPVRGQRPPSGEAADGCGPCTPLWGGCSGTEDSRCSQSAAWGEVSQGAISQDALRRSADAVGDVYRTLRTSV